MSYKRFLDKLCIVGKITDPFIQDKWYLSDITDRAADRKIIITRPQAMEVLKKLKRIDANIGINWESIDMITQQVLEDG